MFKRPGNEARQALYKSVGGSWWKYVLSVLAVGFGVSGLEHIAEMVRRSHPVIARLLFGNPGIVFVFFGILFLVAGVGYGIQKCLDILRRRWREGAAEKRT